MFDPSILAQQSNGNVLASYLGGMQAGQQVTDQQQRNALAQYASQNGSAIMQGDQSALNGLTQFGLQGLELAQNQQGIQLDREAQRLGMDATRQNMDVQRQTQARLDRQEARQIREALQQADAAAIAQEREALEGKLGLMAQAHASGDRAAFEGLVQQFGFDQDPNDNITYDNFLAKAGEFRDVLDIYGEVAAEKAQQTGFDPDRYRVVGSQLIDLGAEGGPSAVLQSPGQEEVIYGPDGQPIVSRGPTGTASKLTEGQSKDIGFAARARDAIETLNSVDSTELTSRTQQIADAVPLGIGQAIQSDDFQVAKNAGTQFLLAILRKDTGAAVTPSEEQMYGDAFLPRPGNGEALLAQKARAREIAIASLEEGMPPEAILAQGRAIARADAAASGTPDSNQVTPADIQAMSAEQLSQYMLNLDVTQLPDEVLEAIMARGE